MRKAVFYIVMFVFSIIFIEIILFAISLVFPVYPIHNISLAIPDPQLGFRPNPGHPDHDENGFRNDKVPQTIGLVALGDSQTYGSSVSRKDAWPQQLQQFTKINVYNMAFGGYGPAHGLMLLDEALAHKPTHVVQAFYSGNDLYDSFHLIHNLNNLGFLKSTDSLAVERIQRSNETQLIEDKIEEAFNYKDKNQFVKVLRKIKWLLFNNSRIYRLLSATINTLSRKNIGVAQLVGAFDRNLALEYPEDCLTLENTQFSVIFRPKYRGTALDLQYPRINEGLHISLGAINEIKKQVQKAETQFLVVCIPTKELVFEREVKSANILDTPAGAYYELLIKNEKRIWKLAREFFTEQKLDFVEALPYLRKQLDLGKQPFPTSDEHLNKLGNFAVAQCVYDNLVRKLEAGEL